MTDDRDFSKFFKSNSKTKIQRIVKRSTSHRLIPWFQRFIFINFIAKGRGKIGNRLSTAASHKNLKTSSQISYLLRCSELLKVLILLPILNEGNFLVIKSITKCLFPKIK